MKMSKHEEKLLKLLTAEPLLKEHLIVSEYRFTSPERWRFDFAIPSIRLAFEAEGGVWMGGRHVTPKGFIGDCKKYNRAVLEGWKVYRLPPELINKEYIIQILQGLV